MRINGKHLEPARQLASVSRPLNGSVRRDSAGNGLAGFRGWIAGGVDCSRSAALPAQLVAQALETPVLRGLLPVVITFSCNTPSDFCEGPVGNGQTLLLYCTRGSGWTELRGRRHTIEAGDLLVIPPREPRFYGAQAGQPWTYFCVQVTGTNLEFFLSQLGASADRPVLNVGEDPRLLGWMMELLELIGADCGPADLIYASQTLAHLFSALICRHRENQRHENGTAKKIEDSIVYMKQHLDEPLRAAKLASVAHMSLPHYFVLFKRETGCTPIDYFINLRMEHARHLLAATSWCVKEVAAALGYEDPLYFSRVFKANNHVTPTAYRVRPNGPAKARNGRNPTYLAMPGKAGVSNER